MFGYRFAIMLLKDNMQKESTATKCNTIPSLLAFGSMKGWFVFFFTHVIR